MRAQLLNGTGSPRVFGIRPTRGSALVNGPDGGGDSGDAAADDASSGVGGAISNAVAWIGSHAVQIVQWVGHLLGMGGSYDASNGGELARQFGPVSEGGTGWLGQPWCNAYMDWLKNYRPRIWAGLDDVWTAGSAAPSPWRAVYERYLAAGLPPGALLDANMVPVGLAQAQQAVAETEAVQNHPTAPPPNAQQLQALQVLAMQLAGLGTPADQAAAADTVAQLPNGWRNYVNALVRIWQASAQPGPNDSAAESSFGGTGLLLAIGAALILSNK